MNDEFDPFVAEWKSYAKNHKLNLIEKCLKLAQIFEYSNLNIEKEVQKISNLVDSLKNCVTESKNQTYKISLLNEFIYQRSGTTIIFSHNYKSLPVSYKSNYLKTDKI